MRLLRSARKAPNDVQHRLVPPGTGTSSRLVGYIADFDTNAAVNLLKRLEEVVQPLAEHPYMFRPGRVPGTREIVAHANYLIIYRVLSDEIDITPVVHARQEYP